MLPKVLTPLFVIIFSLPVLAQSPASGSTPASIAPEMQKIIDQNTPVPLPQTPVAQKDRSDAHDENIKGKVKIILSESETVGRADSRRMSSIEDFDERGNRLKRVAFDYRGNPREIRVYGYIDGARVSKSMYITYDYNPPPPPAPLRPKNAPPEPPRDHRYHLKYEYKYKDGKMTEEILYANNGKLVIRIIYKRKSDTELEILTYDSKGDLNQKFVHTLDKAGNEIAEFNPDLIPGKPYGDRRSVTRYDASDPTGNWTKKTVSFYRVQNNGTDPIPTTYLTYRTITYYK